MSRKGKNKNSRLTDILRYRNNEMTGRERNAFERSLQKDSFTEEALQGFEEINPEKAEDDILELKERLKLRTAGRTKVIWYRIAASVAVLMILSSIFIIVEKNKPQQLSYSPVAEPSKEIAKPEIRDKPTESQGEQPQIVREKKDVDRASETRQKVQPGIKKQVIEPPVKNEAAKEAVRDEKTEVVQITEVREPENIRSEALTSKSALAKQVSKSIPMVRGRVISAEDNQPVPGVSINIKGTNMSTVTDTGGNFNLAMDQAAGRTLVANFIGMERKEFNAMEDSTIEVKLKPSVQSLSEVVVVGYGIAGADSDEEAVRTGYTPPLPATGKAYFDRYIQDNLKRPDEETAGQRVVVVLSFLVNKDGRIDKIRIIRSPAESFSEEAIRLIKEGPAWKPAEENGKPIDDEVRVRIVFK